MKKITNIYISSNIVLIYYKILYITLLKIYGVYKYKINIILTLQSISIYKNYNNITYSTYIYLTNIFNYITFNINNFKKKSNLYIKKKYTKFNLK